MSLKLIDYLPPKEDNYYEDIKKLYQKECKTITFQITENCNLACTYCYQHHKTKNKMSFSIAKQFIDNLLNNNYSFCTIETTKTIILEFIGGEPFLEIDLIEQICEYIFKKMIQLHHPWLQLIKINICSNGILYNTSKVQKFFKKFHNFIYFTISIDGNKELHDSCRKDLEGKGTYDRAIAAMFLYKKQYKQQISTKLTISPDNIKYLYLAIVDLINKGYIHIYANCVFENVWDNNYAKIFYNQLKAIGDYLIDNNLYNKINISLFNENLFHKMDNDDNNNWCGGIADTNIAIDYLGNFYSCIRYMESSLNHKQKPLNIGNVYTGYLSCEQEKNNYKLLSNITRRTQSTDRCYYCPIGAGCAWCSAFNYEEFGTPNKRTTYICLMHQARALANQYYWNKLYKQLNINKIMQITLPQGKEIIIND